MKKDIHPKEYFVKIKCNACQKEFQFYTTDKSVKIDTCSNDHPFYAGKNINIARAGRADKFNKKYNR